MSLDSLDKMKAHQKECLEEYKMFREALRQEVQEFADDHAWEKGERKPLDNVGRVALVCMANNEERYIREWADYHFKLGVDEIFVYEHDWRMEFDIPNVTKIPFDGPNRHVYSCNDFIYRRAQGFDWAIFLDVDEFLVLKKHANIKEFLRDYGNLPGSVEAIAVNWMLFGDNGHKEMTEGGVLERFTRRGMIPARHIKVIVRLNGDRMMLNPHSTFGFWIDTDGKVGQGQNNWHGNCDVIQVNHYFCKSLEEFKQKKLGQLRADCYMTRTMKEYDLYNQNEVEDLTALNFYRGK